MVSSGGRDVVQVIPAAGWAAVHEEKGEAVSRPLACFALVEQADGSCAVVGVEPIEGRMCPTEEQPSFLGYAYVGKETTTDPTDFRMEAHRRQAKRRLSTSYES